MKGAGLGNPLTRERVGAERYLVWGYPAIALAFGAYFLFLGASFGPVGTPIVVGGAAFVSLGLALVTAIFLGIPQRGGIYEHGVLVAISRWKVIAGRGRRMVPAQEIQKAWPIMDVRPVDDQRRFVGFEVVYPGGQGRIDLGGDSEDRQEWGRFSAALRTMLGSRWGSAYYPVVQLSDNEVDQIRAIVSKPSRNWNRTTLVGLAIVVGGLFVGQLTVSLQRQGVGAPWTQILEASFVGMGIAGFCVIVAGWRSGAPRKRALAWYWQVREYEREAGVRVLPDFPVHPDYARFAPALDAGQAELQRLVRDIGRERQGVAFGVLTIASPIVALIIEWALDLPSWTFWMALVLMFACFLVMFWAIGTAAKAGQQLESIVREEWKTGRSILPPGARLPRRYLRVETPPVLTDRQLNAMRLARRIGRPRLALFPVLGILAALSVLPLHLRGWAADIVIGVSIGSGMLFFIWAEGHESYLRRLREYEDVSGRVVLPSDLREHDN